MATQCNADPSRVKKLKQLLVKATELGAQKAGLEGNIGVLIDDTYGQDALNDVTGKGWWIGRPVELPSSRPIELEGGRSIGDRLKSWPREHVVKCLVFYHPNDSLSLMLEQERQIKELYLACCSSGHELLLEIIPPAGSEVNDETLPRALSRIYNLGVRPDWWKLPGMSRASWQSVSDIIKTRAPHCRGVVMLGLDAPADELQESFNNSAGFDICKGFTVGRTIFTEPSKQWLKEEIDDQAFIKAAAENYLQLIGFWRNRCA